MKFSQLLQTETSEIQSIVYDNYLAYGLRISGDRSNWQKPLLKMFNSFSKEIRSCYQTAVSSKYKLTPKELTEHFGSFAAEVRKNGLYLYFKQADAYFPPEEFVPILVEGSLAAVLTSLSKANILRSVPEELSKLRKEDLITEIIRNEKKHYPQILEENRDSILAELAQFKWPFSRLLEQPVHIYDSASRKLIEAISGRGTYYQFNFSELPGSCEQKFGSLLKRGILFYCTTSSTFYFVMHPTVQSWFKEHRAAVLSGQKQILLNQPEPMLKKGPVLYHCDPTTLRRKIDLITQAITNREIGFTIEGDTRKSDITKFIKSFVAKEILPTEQAGYLRITEILFQSKVFSFKYSEAAAVVSTKALDTVDVASIIQKSFKLFGFDLMAARELVGSLPVDKWFDIASLINLEMIAQKIVSNQCIERNAEYFAELITVFCLFVGELDIAFGEGKSPGPVAVRRVLKSKLLPENASIKVAILSNLEIPIAPDLNSKKVRELAAVFSVKDLYTLVLDAKAVNRYQSQGVSAAEYIKLASSALGGDIPKAGLAFIEKSLVVQEPVRFLDSGLPIMVSSDSQADLIRANFKGKITSEYLNRLFLIESDKFSRIETKLKALGIPAVSEFKTQAKDKKPSKKISEDDDNEESLMDAYFASRYS